MKLSDKFLELAAVGSEWILWLLLGLSLLTVAVMIERLIFYGGLRNRDAALVKQLHSALADNDLARAQALVKDSAAPGGRIATPDAGDQLARRRLDGRDHGRAAPDGEAAPRA